MFDKIPGLEKIALGPVQMVLQSIHDYMEGHDGEFPKRIELHPVVIRDFRNDYWQNYTKHAGLAVIDEVLSMVPVIPNVHAAEPRLVTKEGSVQYL